MRNDWDVWFLQLAEHASKRSKDPSTKCGAVLADSKNRIIGFGYNGFPRGIADTEERLNDRKQKYPRVVHAELNAILNARGDTEGTTLYTWPISSCPDCAKVIIQAGIIRVVFPFVENITAFPDKPGIFNLAREMFAEADVEITEIRLDD